MSAAMANGSGFATVGPGKGPGMPIAGKPRNTSLGPGGSGWSGYVVFSFVAAGSCITHVAHDARIRGVRKSGGKTRPHPDHPDPWRISAGFACTKPGPYPDPEVDPPGPAGSHGPDVPRRARAPPSCWTCRPHQFIRRIPTMKNDTITTFMYGEMTEIRPPEWMRRAQAICSGGEIPWQAALTRALNAVPHRESMAPNKPDGAQVLTWVLREEGGHYVEFCTPHHILDAVWVPEKAEWLPFRTKHILPFLQAYAAMATANSLQRLLQHVAPATEGQIPRSGEHKPLPPAWLQAAQWGTSR